jgi:hypothetical protein
VASSFWTSQGRTVTAVDLLGLDAEALADDLAARE